MNTPSPERGSYTQLSTLNGPYSYTTEECEPIVKPNRTYFSRRDCIIVSIVLILAIALIATTLSLGLPRLSAKRELYYNPIIPSSPSILHSYPKAAVVSDGDACAPVGKAILKKNGSAVDAALALLICDGVVNPQSTGLGGGFLMTIYNRSSQFVEVLDAREVAPSNASGEMYQGNASLATAGGLAIAVPGELKGYIAAYLKYGRLNWTELFKPAIEIARVGFRVGPHLSKALSKRRDIILSEPSLRELFFNNDTGDIYQYGEILRRPRYAQTLQDIADAGPSMEYADSLGIILAKEIQDFGGIVTADDFASYTPRWLKPTFFRLGNGDQLFSAPPPGSGAILAFIFNVLQGYNLTDHSTEAYTLTLHRIIETFKFAYAKRSHLGDHQNNTELLMNLTDPSYGAYIRSLISDEYTFSPTYYKPSFYFKDKGTSHTSVVAENGDAVSVSSTVNGYFGSLRRSFTTGIVFNNEMDDFGIPGFVNHFDMVPSPYNLVSPGQRPMSSMSPSIMVKPNGDVHLVIGAVGGSRIITSQAMTILRMHLGDNLKEAVDYPRLHHQLLPNAVLHEKSFPQLYLDELKEYGHDIMLDTEESSVYGIYKNPQDGNFYSTVDYRKGGSLDGY